MGRQPKRPRVTALTEFGRWKVGRKSRWHRRGWWWSTILLVEVRVLHAPAEIGGHARLRVGPCADPRAGWKHEFDWVGSDLGFRSGLVSGLCLVGQGSGFGLGHMARRFWAGLHIWVWGLDWMLDLRRVSWVFRFGFGVWVGST